MRTPWVQSTLAWLVSVYLGATLATMRWRFENRGPVDAAVGEPAGAVACFWHGRIALAVVCRRVLKRKPRRVLISNSPDGELIAKIVGRLSFPAIRGSTTMDSRANRRSIGAFREAVRFIDAGGVVAITPDGPRGPAEQMPQGPVMLARARQTPVFLFGLAAHPTLTLNSWDKTQIPLPFGRGCVVFEGPLTAPHDAEPETIRLDWQARLSAAQARAEALLAA
ncbi:MAG TPA: lysophospholipid acyltransferase family protein [Caulobacteraceae bacterium]|nr:lysophospholipid acyltransferase family protein [Caulobacteraceae bacterium]